MTDTKKVVYIQGDYISAQRNHLRPPTLLLAHLTSCHLSNQRLNYEAVTRTALARLGLSNIIVEETIFSLKFLRFKLLVDIWILEIFPNNKI